MFPLGYIIHWDNVSINGYADDTQLYVSTDPSDIMQLLKSGWHKVSQNEL